MIIQLTNTEFGAEDWDAFVIPKHLEAVLELSDGRGQKRCMLEIQMLKPILINRKSIHLLREYVNNHEQHVGETMDVKGHSNEVSDGNEEHIGN